MSFQVRYEQIDGELEKGDHVLCPMDEIGIVVKENHNELPWNNRHKVKLEYTHVSEPGDIQEYTDDQLTRITILTETERESSITDLRPRYLIIQERIDQLAENLMVLATSDDTKHLPLPQEWVQEIRKLVLEQDNTIIEDKAQYAVMMLRRYARVEHTLPRSTSDLSPLEQWLLVELYKKQFVSNKSATNE